jgi:hypothetical protein
LQELVVFVVFVAVTDNGAQPLAVFSVNVGANGDSMQMVLEIVVVPHPF